MPRLKPYISAVLAFLATALVVIFSNDAQLTPAISPPLPQAASSTVSVVPSPSVSPAAVEDTKKVETATTTKVSVPKKVTQVETPKIIAPVIQNPATVSVPIAPASSGNVPLDTAASMLRGALVNILCYAPNGGGLHSISGSGIFIDSKGIILTNAHVAQYFLLLNRGVSCTIRTGMPAVDTYKAALIYISPAWIHANATILTQSSPVGTGEYDFAFLAVTGSATSRPLPSSFPFLPLAETPSFSGTPVVIATYGAQFLETSQIQSALYPTVVFGSVKNIYTFAVNSIDILALGGSVAAQEGSSGGGVADGSGSLVGTITTSTIQGATDTRSLSAITASYVRSQYSREMGNTLDTLLGEPTSFSVADFAAQIPALESIITASLL